MLDPVNLEPMDDAVSLVPCGHVFSQKTAQELLSRRMVCPLGREAIEKFIPNFKIRELVREAVSKIPQPDQNQPKESKQEGPPLKAVAHFERGKEFYTKGKLDDALVAFIAALSLHPTYAKAEGYLECILEAQQKQANSQDSNPPLLPSSAVSPPSGSLKQQKSNAAATNDSNSAIDALSKKSILNFQKLTSKPSSLSPLPSSALHAPPEGLSLPTPAKTTNQSLKSVTKDPSQKVKGSALDETIPSSVALPPVPSSAFSSQSDRSLQPPSSVTKPKEPISADVPHAPYLEFAFNRAGRGKALCKAVEEGREDIVIYLLGQDTDLNVENENKNPLRIACEKNRDRILRILIGNGAQVNGEDGKKALLFAVENGLKVVARILAENGAPIMEKKGPKANKVYAHNQTPCLPLEFIAKTGDIEFLRILLNTANQPEGLKLDAFHTYRPSIGICTDHNILTVGGHALLTACGKGHLEFVRLLLEAGVKLNDLHTGNSYMNVYQTLGASAFLLALEENHENLMGFFIKNGMPLDEIIGSNCMTLRTAVLARLNPTRFPKLFQLVKTTA
ncbi:MAG: ankyrin repeat domain-containing protein [Verrucomicrobia bacterium]|nr:ankyrin repeat domain-containing protein [Verrucomicrobiota bacterium]